MDERAEAYARGFDEGTRHALEKVEELREQGLTAAEVLDALTAALRKAVGETGEGPEREGE